MRKQRRNLKLGRIAGVSDDLIDSLFTCLGIDKSDRSANRGDIVVTFAFEEAKEAYNLNPDGMLRVSKTRKFRFLEPVVIRHGYLATFQTEVLHPFEGLNGIFPASYHANCTRSQLRVVNSGW